MRAQSSTLLPWFIPLWLLSVPQTEVTIERSLFEDLQDIQVAVTSSLRAIPQEDVQRSFESLLVRATRCIDAEGMYFE